MLVEEIGIENLPNATKMFSINESFSTNSFIKCIQMATPYFVNVYKEHKSIGKLNEDKISQLLQIEIEKIISRFSFPFLVGNQFVDDNLHSKGKPDFFFFDNNELGKKSKYLFFVEAKRLPSPTFTTEYVIGKSSNGGIERYKLGSHGKGKREGGLIGYIQSEDYSFWLKEINSWILKTSKIDKTWDKSEKLKLKKGINLKLKYYHSKVIRKSSDMLLHHIHVDLQ